MILSSGLSRSYSSSSDPDAGGGMDFRTNTALRIRTANGKLKRIRFEQKDGFYQYYREGTFVRHYAGLPYPLADHTQSLSDDGQHRFASDSREERPPGNYLCVACGRLNDEPGFCDICHHSVIDPGDVF